MAKQRYAQFFRNTSIATYQDYETAKSAIISAFESNKQSLKDGEFILGRYAFPDTGEAAARKFGVVVGVARRSGDTVNLDFIADENYVNWVVDAMDLAATTVGTLKTSASVSTVTLYNVSQSNGKVSVGTTSDTLDIAMAGQYNASTNKVALESTVSNAVSGITSSEAILEKSADGKTYTFGTLITQTDGKNDVTGSEALVFKTAPTSNNPIITESDLSGVVSAMVYKGTVDSQHSLPNQGVQPGWTYVVAENGTYAGKACEVGDMIIAKDGTPSWNVVSGENQYEFNDVAVSVGGGLTTIGTIDGAALKISVTDNYSMLVGTADADDVQNPTVASGQINVLNRVEEANGVISAVTAYTLSTVASSGNAHDVSVDYERIGIVSTNVEDALAELIGSINNMAGNIVDGGNGITVSTGTIGSSVISTVSVGLAEKSHAIGSTNYNTGADNLLLIGSDGKLTIEDTWDCGTY